MSQLFTLYLVFLTISHIERDLDIHFNASLIKRVLVRIEKKHSIMNESKPETQIEVNHASAS